MRKQQCFAFRDLWDFFDNFNKISEKEEQKLPYHINLIDELHANENVHSRILEKLLKQQDLTNKKYEILESFIEYIQEKCPNKDDNDFYKIKIKRPQITQEEKRIDLCIKDDSYVIIIENKVAWARDQSRQLERYINVTKEYCLDENRIFVLYLPPTHAKEPDRQTWGIYFGKNIHKRRYMSLSFKEDILPWLKNDVLPNVRLKDKYLSSAIEQYIDHIEGMFSLRTIDNDKNMKLQRFIIENLEIEGVEPQAAFDKISEKIQNIEEVLTQLDIMRENFQNRIDAEYFSMCFKKLNEKDFGTVVYDIEGYSNYNSRSVGVKMENGLTIWIGREEGVGGGLFCQLNTHDDKAELVQDAKERFIGVVGKGTNQKNNARIFKYVQDKDTALEYLIEFIKQSK